MKKKFKNLLKKEIKDDKKIDKIVSDIIDQVKNLKSDKAIIDLTKEFDKFD